MLKIYLSSPERLLKDGKKRFAQYEKLAAAYGFQLLPLPAEAFKLKDTPHNSELIARKRLALIRECDVLIGYTRDFRSPLEPYDETALEEGIAYGLGKKVYSYMPDARTCQDRYSGVKHFAKDKKCWVDENDTGFEPGPLNVMLEYGSQIIEGDFRDVLEKIRDDQKEAC